MDAPPAPFCVQELLQAGAFAHPVQELELIETHVSWVILTGLYAYKIKRPVRFDFIDASTLERRRRLCEEELRLNRRLAPDLYVDVTPISRNPRGLHVGQSGPVVEYAVRMRQFDRTQELAALLEARDVAREELEDLGRRLAAFHANAPRCAPSSPYGSSEQIAEVILQNLQGLSAFDAGGAHARHTGALGDWLSEALARLRPLLELRKAGGAVRECHGDLHARNIVRWAGRLLPFDCLEFDPALRMTDVASDVAFLYMDLLGRGRPDLAAAFLDRWLGTSGDYESLEVLPLYAVHRALVRARIDRLTAADARSPDRRAALEARAERREELALALAHPAEPTLMIMHGPSGSGKSWLSEALVASLGAVRVRSDVERKRLARLPALARTDSAPGAGLYDARSTDRTYARLLECAESALRGGLDVIVDATFLHAAQRDLFRALAQRQHCRFLIISCRADPAALSERVAARARAGHDPSEAGEQVLARQLAHGVALRAQERRHAIELDTSGPCSLEKLSQEVRERIERLAHL